MILTFKAVLFYEMRELGEMAFFAKNLTAKLSF
jgi:hypothetical protein